MFNQGRFNDLTKDIKLSKKASESLASRLKEKNLLEKETKITFLRTREKGLQLFFSQEDNLLFCHEIRELQENFHEDPFSPDGWSLFVDSSKQSLEYFFYTVETYMIQ